MTNPSVTGNNNTNKREFSGLEVVTMKVKHAKATRIINKQIFQQSAMPSYYRAQSLHPLSIHHVQVAKFNCICEAH